ncbi:beta-phosphoglucomutase [Breznakia sp. PF5-3]|uniref:HAD family hydrolase n=1 Tax=unclassified Breznakia TaxID=2623764 RepID=UPI002405B875|nr:MULTISPECIES: HAD family phosphatase [unclassified Breznakia]MDF9825447.1 beta-phosphoglucomutase [Breznakia sp. PM6-1]MDF9836325.1 beta-phosphoglucomutase [Breznakia sp. PF5-3]MDF9838556.1 beta-phosphoglucomutase [Breznakia sp. PFB2-8]MDF9860560.1 beta-phosphoglucomutase [Breznakia sp. PH5-24]
MIKAVIFDMDGVIVDTEHYYMDVMRKYLDEVEADYTEELLISFVGSSDPIITRQLDEILQPKLSGKEFVKRVVEDSKKNPVPYKELKMPGLYETLTHFKSRGYKIGLASSSPRKNIETVLHDLEITTFFDTTSSGHEYQESKPNPEIYLDTLKKLDVQPEECLVIEDSELGIAAAKAAGIYVAAIRDQHYGMQQDHADIIIEGLPDSIDVISNLERSN